MTDLDDLQPWEQRLYDTVRHLLDAMPDDLVRECKALADLSPEDRGVRVHLRPEDDLVDFVWVNRWLGSTSLRWVMTGEVPA